MKALLIQLWSFFSKTRKYQIIFFIFLMIFASLLEAISLTSIIPFLTILENPSKIYFDKNYSLLVNLLNINTPNQLIIPITFIFIIIIIFSGLIRWLLLYYQTKISFSLSSDFSVEMYKRSLYQPYNVHISRNSNNAITAISSKAKSLSSSVILPLLNIFSSTTIVLLIIITLLTIRPGITLSVFMTLSILYYILSIIIKKKLIYYGEIISKQQNNVLKNLQEGFGGIRDVILDNSQEIYYKRYKETDFKLRNSQAKVSMIGSSPKFFFEILGFVSIALYALNTTRESGNINIAIPIIGVFALGLQKLLPLMQQIYSSWTTLKGSQAILRDSLTHLNQEYPKFLNNKTRMKITKGIRLENVSFSYEKSQQIVLDKINLSFKVGSKIGIIGTTGSGKSTLLDIIMGLLLPTEGKIYVDDKVINEKNISEWRANIAHVPQSIYLTDASIIENISFGKVQDLNSMDRIILSSKMAKINSKIESMPNGYQTIIGERGVKLSGGQRQRLGIARALYKEADIMIFDEATSALDSLTEEAVMKEIDNYLQRKIIFIVAHRITTLQNCDIIIELEAGRIKTIGKYAEMFPQL
jgi:ABC-type multidrug transport system fused ATPase/permease subunit